MADPFPQLRGPFAKQAYDEMVRRGLITLPETVDPTVTAPGPQEALRGGPMGDTGDRESLWPEGLADQIGTVNPGPKTSRGALTSSLGKASREELYVEALKRGLLPKGYVFEREAPKTGEIGPYMTEDDRGFLPATTKDDRLGPGDDRGFLATTIGNIIPSARANYEGAASLFTPTGLLRTGEALGRSAVGVVEGLAGKETKNTEMANMMFKEFTRIFRDPLGTIQEDPIGAALDIAGILTGGSTIAARAGIGGARMASRAAQAQRIETLAQPLVHVGWVGKELAKGAGKVVKSVTPSVYKGITRRVGKASGVGETALDIAYKAGFARKVDPEKAEAIKRVMGDVGTEEQQKILAKLQEGINLTGELQALRYAEGLKNLSWKDGGSPVDIKKVRTSVARILEKEGVKITPFYGPFKIVAKKKGPWEVSPVMDKTGMEYQYTHITDRAADPMNQTGFILDFEGTQFKFNKKEIEKIGEMFSHHQMWTDNSITGTHNFHQSLKDLTPKHRDDISKKTIPHPDYTNTERIRASIENQFKREMTDKIKGFTELNAAYEKTGRFLSQVKGTLGLSPVPRRRVGQMTGEAGDIPATNEKLLVDVADILNPASNKFPGLRENLVREIEGALNRKGLIDRVGQDKVHSLSLDGAKKLAREHGVEVNLMEELSALRLGMESVPGAGARTGLPWMGAVLGGGASGFAVGGGAGAVVGSVFGGWLAGMTIGNPRALGRLFVGLGAKHSDMVGFVKHLERLKKKTLPYLDKEIGKISPRGRAMLKDPAVIAGSRTIGFALGRARQRQEMDPENQDLFRKLGL